MEILEKSKISALLLSIAGSLGFVLVSATLNLLLPYWLSGDVHVVIANPDSLTQPGNLLALAIILLLAFALLAGAGAYWLYRFFGPAYFGKRGAVRWALFGVLLAFLLQIPIWVLPEQAIPRGILQALGVFAAFFLARWIVPLQARSR
jgi:RsiW-degrading membrane proteinase PrsW (M82 family)